MTQQIGFQAILDDRDFQRGSDAYSTGVARMIGQTKTGASELLVLSQAVNAFGRELDAGGSRTQRYGEAFTKIKQDFAQGKISILEARDAIARLDSELQQLTAAERAAISVQMMRREMAQAAMDVVGLGDRVKNFKDMLTQATPQNIQFAQTFDKIQQEFTEGKITATEAAQAIAQLESQMKAAGTSAAGATKQTGTFFTEMNSKLQLLKEGLRVFQQIFADTFAFGKSGAMVIQTSESFNTLTGSLGGSAELMNQLKAAAGGTVPELQLMTQANMALTGVSGEVQQALYGALPALLEMSRAATKAAPEIGSVDFVFQSLIRGIRRGSPLLIDNANIMVKAGTANEDYAASVGKTVEELTQEEKMLATMNAVLAQHDTLLQQAGGTLDSEVDRYSRMEAAIANVGDAFKERYAPFITQAADAIYYLIEGENIITAVIGEQIAGIDVRNTSYETYRQRLDELAEASHRTVLTQQEQIALDNEQNLLRGEAQNAIIAMTEAEYQHAQQTLALTEAYAAAGVGLNQYSYYSQEAIQWSDALALSYYNQGVKMEEAREAAYRFEERLRILNNQQQELIDKAREAQPAISDLLDTLNQDIGSPLTNFIADLRFAIATGAANFRGALEQIQTALADNKITEAQALEYSGALLAAFENAKVAAGEINFDEAANNLATALGIPEEDAVALLTTFTDLDTVTDGLNKEIAMNVQAEKLDQAVEAAGNLEEGLAIIDETEIAPEVDLSDLENVVAFDNWNQGALEAEQAIAGMVEATGSKVEGLSETIGAVPEAIETAGSSASELEPLEKGLDGVGIAGQNVLSTLRQIQNTINNMDLTPLEPFIAQSPPPLGEGFDYINEVVPDTIALFSSLADAEAKIGDNFSYALLPLETLPQKAVDVETFLASVVSSMQNAEEAISGLDIAGKFLDIAGTFGGLGNSAASILKERTIDPLKKQVDATGDAIEKGLEYFNKKFGLEFTNVDELRAALGAMGGGGLTSYEMGQYEALVRMNEDRAAAAKELAEAEERVLHLQEQQQNLQFLQQQMKLLELIQEYGLNADEILGGLQLGLNADINQVIDAMTLAMQKIIGAAEEELGIHSPSAVARGWATNIMNTFAQTLGNLAELPADAMHQSMNGLFSPRTSSVSYVTNRTGPTINMPMQNYINNRDEGLLFESRVRRIVESVVEGY